MDNLKGRDFLRTGFRIVDTTPPLEPKPNPHYIHTIETNGAGVLPQSKLRVKTKEEDTQEITEEKKVANEKHFLDHNEPTDESGSEYLPNVRIRS